VFEPIGSGAPGHGRGHQAAARRGAITADDSLEAFMRRLYGLPVQDAPDDAAIEAALAADVDSMTQDAKRANRYWGHKSLPKTKIEFFDAVTTPAAAGEGTVATIRMYGPIDSWGGYWGISTKDVGQVLDALPESVTQIILRINSPGGEVFEGLAILNMFRAHKAKVTAVIDGLAASAASFIAVGCDETVMSPGTQMMIHSPWTIAWGKASELRKTADVLDGLETSIIEIYTEKAGEKDWAAMLADDTWLTTSEAMQLGLADRVAVIPDAGEAETVGEDDVELFPDDEEPEDSALAVRLVARAHASLPKPPSSSEPVEPNQKENLVANEDLTAGLRTRLGITDAAATDEALLAALDASLAGSASTNSAAPEGTVLIDSTVLAGLQSDAEQGRQAREEQISARRDGIVDTAVREGRITPASRATWRTQLDTNEEGTVAILGTLAVNTIPVTEIGHGDGVASTEDTLYASAWGVDDQKTEA
jgi:ATP-dependent protease ClpP protease subunit